MDSGEYAVKKMVCNWIWWLSETTGIPLGPLAPYIFGGAMGCKGKQIKPEEFDA